MERKGEYVLRQLMDEYVLIPYKETAEQVNQVITLSDIAAYIYEHVEDVDTLDELADLVSKEYDEPKENVKDDIKMVLTKFEQMELLEKM